MGIIQQHWTGLPKRGYFVLKMESRQLIDLVHNSLSNRMDDDGYINFLRFTAPQMSFYEEQPFFKLMSQCSSGICICFETDGTQITLDCRTVDLSRKVLVQIAGEMSFAEMLQKLGETVMKVNQARSRLDIIQHFDLYLDDHYCDAVRIGNSEVCFDLKNTERRRMTVKIWLPLYKPLSMRSLESDGSIWPVRSERPRLLALGDSITQGFVAGKPSFSYVAQLAELLGVDALNQGIGNITYDANVLTDWENLPRPDLVISAYGTNDWHNGQTLKEIEQAVTAYFTRLADVFPGVPLYVLTPIWRDDIGEAKPCGTFAQLTDSIRKIAADTAGDQVRMIDGLAVSPHNPTCYSDGWLHPNIAGFSYMAPRLYRIIKDWQFDS